MSTEEAAAAAATTDAAATVEEDPAIVKITNQIASLGTSVASAKKAKQPKEEWDPLLQQMLALKLKFKEITGKEFGLPKEDKKPKGEGGEQEASDKNKEKRAKKAAEKAAKEEKKRRGREEREAREREKREKLASVGKDVFGDAPMIQSASKTELGVKRWTRIEELSKEMEGKKVLIRGHLQTSRLVGKGAFILLRSSLHTVQCVAFESNGGKDKDGNDTAIIPSAMIKYMTGVPDESIVDVYGTLSVPEKPVEGATQSHVEIHVLTFHCINKATAPMPFQWKMPVDPTWSKKLMWALTIRMPTKSKWEELDKKPASITVGSISAPPPINPSSASNP